MWTAIFYDLETKMETNAWDSKLLGILGCMTYLPSCGSEKLLVPQCCMSTLLTEGVAQTKRKKDIIMADIETLKVANHQQKHPMNANTI